MLTPTSALSTISKVRPEPSHILAAIKRSAAEDLWKIAALTCRDNTRLREATGIFSDYWFDTIGAAIYCFCKSVGQRMDWYNTLKENRRHQIDILASVSSGKKPRGNVYRLGEVEFHTVGKKVYYTKAALDKWLAGIGSPTTH